MYARVTQFDIDVVQISASAALDRFKELVLPELEKQPGYRGLLVLQNPEGRGVLVSLWASAEAERGSRATGYYEEQVRKFVTFYKQPPGREAFQVTHLDVPEAAAAGGVA
ncbi:MAG: antibiotic biosynthesis monooxygenase [Dehalococcoidia bacterium]|nr:antibiotic biosynthesis monooxygenase [Dehalococcoidia bacterium]